MSWDTEFDDRYAEMAAVLADAWEMRPEYTNEDDYRAQLDVTREEVLELSRAMRGGVREDNEDQVAEELADVLVTVHLLAVQMDVDPWSAYREKMRYNMEKTGTRENGKVVDDAENPPTAD